MKRSDTEPKNMPMDDKAKEAIIQAARDHALRTLFVMACLVMTYDREETLQLIDGLTEKLRREPSPTDDPALAADEVADAFADLLKPTEESLVMLDRFSPNRRK
jgi:hypothetical protein